MIELGENVGGAFVFEPPLDAAHGIEVKRAVFARHGIPRGVLVRRLVTYALESTEIVEYFAAAIRLRLAMRGPNVPEVHLVVGGEGGNPAASIEEDPGDVTLRDLIAGVQRKGTTPIAFALHVARSVASVAAMATTPIGIMPSDVRIGWDGVVRVVINSYPGPEHQLHGAMAGVSIGTFEWLAPEVVTGARASTLTPMFTIGTLLFETITGVYPFAADTTLKGLKALVEGVVPRIETLRPVPADVSAFVEMATQKAPADRFASWEAFLSSLDHLRRGFAAFDARDVRALLAWALPERVEEAHRRMEEIGRITLPAESVQPAPVDAPGAPYRAPAVRRLDAATQRFVWGRDARPMVRVDGKLLVDARTVTCAEYARFTIATGHAPPFVWNGPTPPPPREEEPVTHVTHADAMAYARWAGKRVPTADEWERARHVVTTGALWEWTSSIADGTGWVVRGGRWRDRSEPPKPENTSHEELPAADVGFRCVMDG